MLFVILLVVVLPLAEAHNAHLLVFPNTIRPGMRFDCHVIRQSKYPRLSMFVSLSRRYSSTGIIASKTVELADAYNVISLQVPDNVTFTSSSYGFSAKAKNKFGVTVIDRSAYLRTNQKRCSIFVQTDKSIYKPGQTVQFRVFAVDAGLGVLKNTMDIDINDPSSNKIAIWRDVDAPSGVFQGEMTMSSEPPLGKWSIVVRYDECDTITKTFTVEEFVLPKFEVSISTPGYAILTDKYVSGSVSAQYTFGKGVEGNGTLIVKKKYLQYREVAKKYSLSFKIDGDYKFTIDREELFAVIGLTKYATTVLFEVNVTETLTGNTLSDTGELRFYSQLEKLSFENTPYQYFRPGFRYTGYVSLTDPRDRPLQLDDATINISGILASRTDINVDGRQVNFTASVSKNGIATFSFKMPKSANSMLLTARYAALTLTTRIQQFRSQTNTYLQLTLLTENPKVRRNARFLIRSTKRKRHVICMILARGMIVHSERIYMEKKWFVWKVPITSEMSPSARIVVLYIKGHSTEVIADAATFRVDGLFENKVKVRFGRKTSKPGKNVNLIVKADPGSQCNVLAVDKSVLLLKQGNDITTGMVQDDLKRYDYINSCGTYCMKGYYAVPIKGQDVASLFSGTGLAYITNALLYRYYPERYSSSSSSYFRSTTTSGMPTVGELTTLLEGTTTTTGQTTPASAFSSVYESESDFSTWTSTGEEEVVEKEAFKPEKPPTVRSLFPDTWIYSNSMTANSRGRCYINATVPDTITSWVATAFAVHNSSGLGIAPESANLDVFLKFFIRLELPYSVIRGEQLILQASVFNFFDTDLEVEVRLRKSQCFENILVLHAANGSTVLSFTQEDIIRQVSIRANKAITLNFPIRPVELGMCKIDIQAISPTAGDAVKRDLLVKAEGIEENYNVPILIEVSEGEVFTKEQPITLPEDIVPGSVKIRVSVVGDLMGPSMTGLTNLLRMPSGCGEQNMIGFVPNIVVIKYLEAVNKLKSTDLETAKRNMMAGYQREMNYMHSVGSFSAYGGRDYSGSTWLTAYVVKSFAQASPYIFIDPLTMQRSINWLIKQYDLDDGTFDEPGTVFSKSMQGGSATGVRNLASYVIIALFEAKNAGFMPSGDGGTISKVLLSAVKSLENSVQNMTDLYEMAIASYALALVESDKVSDVMSVLEGKAKFDDGKYWQSKQSVQTSWWSYYSAISKDVEINSYILLAYVKTNDIPNAIQVMKWLVRQRNSYGGFRSTQDTVMGLQALAAIAGLIYTDDFDVQITVKDKDNRLSEVFIVNPDNAMIFQTAFIPGDTSLLQIEGTGKGICLLQISVTYNEMEDPVEPLFTLAPSFTDETMDGFWLQVCFSWLGERVSGMAVMEISLLSGFTADQFSVTSLGILKRVEEGDNMLVLYFDEITSEVDCIKVQMERTGLVAGSQPAVIKLYDYYDTENHVIGYYQPHVLRDTNVCDFTQIDIGCSA